MRTIVVIGLAAVALLMSSNRGAAQAVGSEVLLLLPADAQVVGDWCASNDSVFFYSPPCAPGDTLVPGTLALVTGRSMGTTSTGSCAQISSQGQLQQVVLVDPAGGRAAMRVDAIVAYPLEGLKPGTRVGKLEVVIGCTIGSTTHNYFMWRSFVE